MKQIVIAFDIDGTILNNEGIPPQTPVNIEVVMLLQILSKMKNSRIIVWSGGGKEYAENIVRQYGLEKYVDAIYGKEACEEHVDIAFDDVHACEMGDKNLIVKMK